MDGGNAMRKKYYYLAALFLIISSFTYGCSSGNNSGNDISATDSSDKQAEITATEISDSKIIVDTEFTANDLDVGYEESTATKITLQGDSMEVTGNGATVNASTLTITEEGTYLLTGSLEDGQIIVDVGDNDKVQLVLNGVTIHCQDQAPIYVKNADKVFITLNEGTINTLTDGEEYVQSDDNTVDGVIFSKADLTLNGQGTLNITANYKHGILSKDTLAITGGTYHITAVKDAINGKDAVKIKDGNFTLSSNTGNGIQSKHDEDETKGYVYICGGTITVTSCQEGIEGTAIVIQDGTIDITAQDDGMNASSGITTTTSKTVTGEDSLDDIVNDKTATQLSTADQLTTAGQLNTAKQLTTAVQLAANSTDSVSASTDKNTAPDSSANTDNSVDANSSATKDNNITQKDMGGGGFGGGFGHGGGFGGGGDMENNTNCYILISGGNITINAAGDGIDSNGSVFISGGNTYICGPTSGGDSGLDYNGTANITGGKVIIVGSIGMAQGFSDSSTQYSILYNLSSASEAGTELSLKDSDGNTIISYTPTKQYQSLVISSPELTNGSTYTLTSGSQSEEITLSSVVTSNVQGGMSSPGMGGRNDRGNMPNQGEMPDPGTMPNQGEMPSQEDTTNQSDTTSQGDTTN